MSLIEENIICIVNHAHLPLQPPVSLHSCSSRFHSAKSQQRAPRIPAVAAKSGRIRKSNLVPPLSSPSFARRYANKEIIRCVCVMDCVCVCQRVSRCAFYRVRVSMD